jgi:hypothetical protein
LQRSNNLKRFDDFLQLIDRLFNIIFFKLLGYSEPFLMKYANAMIFIRSFSLNGGRFFPIQTKAKINVTLSLSCPVA